jgi:hypothetical protein
MHKFTILTQGVVSHLVERHFRIIRRKRVCREPNLARWISPRLPRIRVWFDEAPQPKELIVLDGSAHAQFLFQTDQAERVMKEVLRFLSAKD